MAAILPFIFDTSKGETPASVAKMRAIAETLAQQDTTPRNVGEGLTAVGNALAYRGLMAKASAAESAGQNSVADAWGQLAKAIGADDLMGSPSAAGATPGGAPPPAAAPTTPSPSQADFVKTVTPYALAAAQATGLDPRLIIAQAAQETGWGQSAPGNNYFGIKSHGVPGGQTLATSEYDANGQKYGINDSFRAYQSPQQSFEDYANFLKTNSRYQPLLGAQGLDAQLSALGASGYATDPKYASEVGSIARGITLPSYQNPDPRMTMNVPGNYANPDPGMTRPVPASFTNPDPGMTMNPPMTASAPTQAPPPVQTQPQPAQRPPMPQVAQAAQIPTSALMGVLTNPWATDGQRAVAQALLQRQMQQNDPEYRLKLQIEQQQLYDAQHPKPDYGFVTLPDGTVLKTDKTGGTASPVYQSQPKPNYGFTTLPDGTVLKTDPNTGSAAPVYQSQPKPPSYGFTTVPGVGVIATDPTTGTARKALDIPPGARPLNPQEAEQYKGASWIDAEGQPHWAPQGTTINNNLTPASDLFAGLPKDVRDELFKRQSAAQDAADIIKITNEGRQVLDQGAITGAGAGIKVAATKWAGSLGIPVPQDAANNSETFKAVMGQAVGKIIKQFGSGTGLSDADRQYAQQIVGGNIELNDAAIRHIFDIAEKSARSQIDAFGAMRDKVLSGDLSAMLGVSLPDQYVSPSPANPAPAAPPPPSPGNVDIDALVKKYAP